VGEADRIAERRARFRALHERGCFVLPNPWDRGSARWLARLGFVALASTSSGMAFARGLPDMAVPLEAVLAHLEDLVGATDLPVNADFEDGHSAELDGLAANVRRCLATGVAGLSIEDATGRAEEPLYPLEEAVARIRTARRVIDASGTGAVLVGRAECFLTGHPDPLVEAIRRLEAYAEAGADCLYAPGLRTPEEIRAVVAAVSPKPLNLLVSRPIGLVVADLAALGVRRISLGGALARAAWGGFARAASLLAQGSFAGLEGALPLAELDGAFAGFAERG
jgi:2-methylisocitrate lyase-like PEP mutase family enzyme